jgi:LAO/AO transport system kinase
MHVLAEPGSDIAQVVNCSSVTGAGLDAIWQIISGQTSKRKLSGALQARRSEQNAAWMWSLVDQQLHDIVRQRPVIDALAKSVASQVRNGTLSPMVAADRIIAALFASSSPSLQAAR